jgi:hypothetical protein
MRTAIVCALALGAASTACRSETSDDCSGTVAYADVDGDGRGSASGSSVEVCAAEAPPAGYALSSDDCDDRDAARWERRHVYRDEDTDGRGGAEETLCLGDGLPPAFVAMGGDCDDEDATRWRGFVRYPDIDGDGVGASPREVPCVGETLPDGEPLPGTGYAVFGWDVDDGDSLRTEPPHDADGPLAGTAPRGLPLVCPWSPADC